MLLSQDILNALKEYGKKIKYDVMLTISKKAHTSTHDLRQFVEAVAGTSDRISVTESDDIALSPLSIQLSANGKDNIQFNGIPGGHEFNSFVLALLHIGGHTLSLDEGIANVVNQITEPLRFEVFVSLSCHNCPDVVQTLNQFAVLNDNIRVETIDGGVNQDRIEKYNIQGVPTVYVNGKPFASGKVEPSTLLEKLIKLSPPKAKSSKSTPLQDMLIIGGGPAGVSAAIYGARKGLNVTLVAQKLGGQVKDTMGIENFISVPYTTGTELSSALRKHMGDYKINLKESVSVDSIKEDNKLHHVTLNTGEVITSKTVIIATGAQWRKLGISGEEKYSGNGVAYCPHCDGPFYKGKDVAVVGGGNSGIEAAIDLAGITKSVTVIEFAPELKADQVLVDKALSLTNVTILKNQASKEVTGDGKKVNGITITDRDSNKEQTLAVEGIFVQIGLIPNSKGFSEYVNTNRFGEIIVDDKCKTNTSGVFACGDVTTTPYKQIIIATGEGAKASLGAFEYLMTFQQ